MKVDESPFDTNFSNLDEIQGNYPNNSVLTGATNIEPKVQAGGMKSYSLSPINTQNSPMKAFPELIGTPTGRTVTTANDYPQDRQENETTTKSRNPGQENQNNSDNGLAPSLHSLAVMSKLSGTSGSALFGNSSSLPQVLQNLEKTDGKIANGSSLLDHLGIAKTYPDMDHQKETKEQNEKNGHSAHSDIWIPDESGSGLAQENQEDDTSAEEGTRNNPSLNQRNEQRKHSGVQQSRKYGQNERSSDPSLSETERKKIKRRISNRESARRVRQKKQELLEELQLKCTALTKQNSRLVAIASNVESQRLAMVQFTNYLKDYVRGVLKEKVELQSSTSILKKALSRYGVDPEVVLSQSSALIVNAQRKAEYEFQHQFPFSAEQRMSTGNQQGQHQYFAMPTMSMPAATSVPMMQAHLGYPQGNGIIQINGVDNPSKPLHPGFSIMNEING